MNGYIILERRRVFLLRPRANRAPDACTILIDLVKPAQVLTDVQCIRLRVYDFFLARTTFSGSVQIQPSCNVIYRRRTPSKRLARQRVVPLAPLVSAL